MSEKCICKKLKSCDESQTIKYMLFYKDLFEHYLKYGSIQSKFEFNKEKG